MRLFKETHIDFMSKRNFWVWVSITVNIIGLISPLFFGLRFGIDFEGGTEMAVSFAKVIHTDQVRSAVDRAGIAGAEIKSYGKDNQFLIRFKDAGNGADLVKAEFVKEFNDNTLTILKIDKIGPKIGRELRFQALIAVLLSIVAILLYVAFRFEFVYGFGAILSLIHDVIVAFAAVVIVGWTNIINLEINQPMLAAILTVIGFSINDTVIIFDRIRENKDIHKGMGLIKLINLSVNETLSRTIITVFTVVVVLATMVAMGGEVLAGFSFTMLIGIITGTYSSIYIASAFVVWYLEKIKKIDLSVDKHPSMIKM